MKKELFLFTNTSLYAHCGQNYKIDGQKLALKLSFDKTHFMNAEDKLEPSLFID